jgi:peptide/nickel transport system permease protein
MPDRHLPRSLLVLLLGLLALAVSGGLTQDPFGADLSTRLQGPSTAHWLGQDALGRDVLARLTHGARISFVVAFASVTLSFSLGIVLGALAALRGGWTDLIVARAIDIVLAFPGLLLAIMLAAIRGPGVGNVIVALVVLGWPSYARLARAELTRLARTDFADAARALGASPAWLVTRHLLPLALPSLLVQATFGASHAVVAEASLSFLGLGVPVPTPSWGTLLDEGRQFLLVAPHLVLAPGLALGTTVFLLQSAGDALRDRFDVRTDALQR